MLAVLAALVVLAGSGRLSGTPPVDPAATPGPSFLGGLPGARLPVPSAVPPPARATSRPSAPAGSPGSTPDGVPRASPPARSPPDATLPLVPVAGFWSSDTSLSLSELRLALAGESALHRDVILPEADSQALASAFGLERFGPGVRSGTPGEIRRAVRDGALGLLRATDVTPAVRALALDGRALFGNDRVRELSDWPLSVAASSKAAAEWEQAATWTLVAGGDIQLDRRMAYQVSTLGKGVDWPWDGGTVTITGRVCCSRYGHAVPEWESTGNEGAVRALFSQADLAMANLEAAAVDDPALHSLGRNFRFSLNFSGDPRLLVGLDNAGFDFLSLANNHIRNAGPEGIRDTRRALRELGIEFAGAGRDLEQASRPAFLEVGDRPVAVLPCSSVGQLARPDRAGAASCGSTALLSQISQAAERADVVIVFPHWGREYRATPGRGQRALAKAWATAGADLVLGAHSHWAGALEEIGQTLVFYSLGNLAFDQPWSERTMQGLIVELTFHADELVQVRLHPTLIVDDVQPNLLERDGGGQRVVERMRDASEGLLPY